MQQWPRILAQATVDVGRFAHPVDLIPFVVSVKGWLQGGERLPDRSYQISAQTDDIAAQAGLQRYEAEFERVN